MFEIWGKYQGQDWELIDEADNREEADYLSAEYTLAFGSGWQWRIDYR